MLQDHEKYVYHYTRTCTLVKNILPTNRIRLSPFSELNDPLEFKNYIFSRVGARVSGADLDAQMDAFATNFRARWRVACFSADVYESTATRMREDKGEDIISAALYRGHSRPQMWAHYANNHAGVCLIFDKKLLHTVMAAAAQSIDGQVHAKRVIYKPRQLNRSLYETDHLTLDTELLRYGTDHAIELHTARYIDDLFFTKNPDWNNEQEYRWIIWGREGSYLHINYQDALVGLILGPRFPREAEKHVKEYGLNNKISIARMDWVNGIPQPSPTHPRLLSGS